MKNRRLVISLVSILILSVVSHAQETVAAASSEGPQPVIKTFQFDSKLMARQIPYSVILPAAYDVEKEVRFPVIYMLPGLGGDHKITKLSSARYTDKQRVIMVFVEGRYGFYTDSATKPNDKYESYFVNELIPEIDKNLRTLADRRGRAIAGVSMGGYGALKFGIKYPQLFSLAISWSGAVNVASFNDAKTLPPIPGLKQMLTSVFGDGTDRSVIAGNDLFRLFADYPSDKLKELPFFYLDCGTEDELGLFKPNRDLSEVMINRKIRHEYRQFPGGHGSFQSNTFSNLYDLSDRIFAKQMTNASGK